MKTLINFFKKLITKRKSQKYLTINIKKEIEYETELDYNNHVVSKINKYKKKRKYIKISKFLD
jgi:hypothetical protein